MDETIEAVYRTALQNDVDQFAQKIKQDMDTRGIAMLPNFFTAAAMQEMRETVQRNYDRCLGGAERKFLRGEDLQGTIFNKFAASDFVLAISNSILKAFGYQVEKSDIYTVLNILQGEKAKDAIHQYHFDSTFVTLAVPVIMPNADAPRRGSFRIWPNVRCFSTNTLKNKYFWRVMRTPWLRDRFRNLAVDFEPGNLYFFYGFRSWHGTGDMDETSLRANCLVNVGGPFFDLDKKRGILPQSKKTLGY